MTKTQKAAISDDRVSATYRRLRELIVGGRLAAGARLIETELAGRLGVSRTPVRAALLRLAQEGYILSPGAGRRARPAVAAPTPADAAELFNIIAGNEGLAPRRAPAPPPPPPPPPRPARPRPQGPIPQ